MNFWTNLYCKKKKKMWCLWNISFQIFTLCHFHRATTLNSFSLRFSMTTRMWWEKWLKCFNLFFSSFPALHNSNIYVFWVMVTNVNAKRKSRRKKGLRILSWNLTKKNIFSPCPRGRMSIWWKKKCIQSLPERKDEYLVKKQSIQSLPKRKDEYLTTKECIQSLPERKDEY